MYANYVKRILDLALSSLALFVLFIPLCVVALCVRVNLGSPVLFKQRRIGKDNKEFDLFKFRSMTEDRDENGVYLPDPDRITKLGHFLRVTSIDELPSLINILKGEMSIIGPRPLPVRYLDRYTNEQKRRHEVRPGLSSPAVAESRNAQTWETQFENDVWYVDHLCFAVDVGSVLKTIKVVLTRKGATADDGDSRTEFIGTANVADLVSDGNYMKLAPLEEGSE